MTIADDNRDALSTQCASKSKELCTDELCDKSFGRAPPEGNSSQEGGVDRLAIRNFGHVGMSWGTRRNGTIFARWRNMVFRSRRSRFTARLRYATKIAYPVPKMILIRRSCIPFRVFSAPEEKPRDISYIF